MNESTSENKMLILKNELKLQNKLLNLLKTLRKLLLNIFLSLSQRIFKVLTIIKASSKFRSTHQRCSVREGVLRNFAKFTGKHLCQSLFFNEVAGLACNFIKKRTLVQVLSCEF